MRKAVVAVAVVVFCSQALAQEQVTLRLKFKPGQVVRYRGYMKGGGTVDMAVQPTPPQPMPTQVAMQGAGEVLASAKVIKQDQWGNTRLRVSLDSARLSMDMMGKKMELVMKGGTMSVTADGQKMGAEKLPKLPTGQAIPLIQKPIEVKFGTRGQLMDIAIPGFEKEMAQMKKMYGGVDPMTMWKQTQILLPEKPIAVGETWNEHQEQPIPGAGAAAVTDTTFNLANVKEVNGQKIAEISVSSTSILPNVDMGAMMRQGMPAGAPPMPGMGGNMAMQTNMAGTVLFNITTGLMDRLDFRMGYSGQMNMTVPTPQQGQGGPGSMAMQMVGEFTGAVARLK